MNSGDIDPNTGINVTTYADNSAINVENSGDIEAGRIGIRGRSYGADSSVAITNSGSVTATGTVTPESVALLGIADGAGSNVVINNSGTARGLGTYGFGLYARTTGPGGTNLLINSGSVYGSFAGIYARSFGGTTIVNSGDISAGSPLAISVRGAAAQIYNSGHITGFVSNMVTRSSTSKAVCSRRN